jgi:hypothetical protein
VWRKRSRFTTHVFTRPQRENATWPSIALVSALWRPSHGTEHPPTRRRPDQPTDTGCMAKQCEKREPQVPCPQSGVLDRWCKPCRCSCASSKMAGKNVWVVAALVILSTSRSADGLPNGYGDRPGMGWEGDYGDPAAPGPGECHKAYSCRRPTFNENGVNSLHSVLLCMVLTPTSGRCVTATV